MEKERDREGSSCWWFLVHGSPHTRKTRLRSRSSLPGEKLSDFECRSPYIPFVPIPPKRQKRKKGTRLLPPPPPNYPSAIYYYYLQLTLIKRERDNFTHLLPQPGSNFPSGPLSLLPLCPYPSFRPFTYSIHVTRSILSDTRG